jgi:hypothetical protein
VTCEEKQNNEKTNSLQITMLSVAGVVLLAFTLYIGHEMSKPNLKEQTLIKQRYDIPADGFPSVGPPDAPVVIVEFSDFQRECGLDYGSTTNAGSWQLSAASRMLGPISTMGITCAKS